MTEDSSKEMEIPKEFLDWAKVQALKLTGNITYGMYEKAPKLCEEMAILVYRYLHPSPSGWIEIKPGCEMPEYTERHKWFNDETGQREEYGEPAFQIVLAYNEELGIFKAKYEKHGRWSEISSCSINGTVKPTHWMPLPTPPIDL
jgi:hypothetical protein